MENTNGCIIIDGKEPVGSHFLLKYPWGNDFCIGTIVANDGQLWIVGKSMFQKRILIAVETVLGDFQIGCRTIIGNAGTSRFYQMTNGIKSTHIVINHHTTGIHARTYSIIEHQRKTGIQQHLEMVVLLRILRLRHNNSADFVFIKRLTNLHLSVVTFRTLCYHDAIASAGSLLLYPRKNCRKVIMCQFGNDDANDFLRLHPRIAQ